MILNGPSGNSDKENQLLNSSWVILIISQIIVFNSVGKRKAESNVMRHSTLRETLVTVYIGNLIYHESRNKNLLDKLHHLGFCISYKRTVQIATDLANGTIDHCNHIGWSAHRLC